MIIAIIYLIMLGSFDNIIYSYELSNLDCTNYTEMTRYEIYNVSDCITYVNAAKVQLLAYIASNMLTSVDIASYLILVKKAINPFILKNKNIVLIISDKLEIALSEYVPIIVHKKNAYFTRQWYKDELRNNHLQIYVKGRYQPLGYKDRTNIVTILNYNKYMMKVSKTKRVTSYNIFKLGHFKRNWILEINPIQHTYIIRSVKKLDPSLPSFKFGLWKRLQIIVPHLNETQELHTESSSINSILMQKVKINVREVTLDESSAYLYSLLQAVLKDAEDKQKLLEISFPIKWIFIALIVFIAIFMMMLQWSI
ncbi:MAG: hypothetical protein QXT65_04545 [Candidatus Nitrosocaldaceae archaeon]